MQQRDWETDWVEVQDCKDLMKHISEPTVTQQILYEELLVREYWLENYSESQDEIKSLREQLAHANCSWQQEKSMRYSAVAREQKLRMFIEDLINSDVDEMWKASAARYLQKVYGDAA